VDQILNKFQEKSSVHHNDDGDDSFFYQDDMPKKQWGAKNYDNDDNSPNPFSRKS
jgi:hypothetical protein